LLLFIQVCSFAYPSRTGQITTPPPWSDTVSLIENVAESLDSDESWYMRSVKRMVHSALARDSRQDSSLPQVADLDSVDSLTEFFKGKQSFVCINVSHLVETLQVSRFYTQTSRRMRWVACRTRADIGR
jgi:hypothetical protein